MRAPRTLSWYVLREVLLFTALGLAALTPLLVSRNLVQLLDDLVAVDLPLADLLAIARCVAAMLASYALPIAFLLAVLLTVGRMAADREVTALRTCGLGLHGILVPVLGLGVLVSGVTGYLTLEVEHRAQRELRERIKVLATRGTMIEPQAFRVFGERVLFVRERGADGEVRGVLLADRSDTERPLLIVAERGRLELDVERDELRLQLASGDIHLAPPGEPAGAEGRISFEALEATLAANELLGADLARLRPREMPMQELVAIVERARAGDPLSEYRKQNPAAYLIQIHRRIALPFASAVFPLVAVPLGLRVRRNARAWGAFLCGALVAGYYALLMFGQFLALEGALPAAVAVWAPNGAVGLAGCGLVLAARRPGF